MDKPLVLQKKIFENNLIDLINSSGLPAFIVETILRNITSQARLASEEEFQIALEQYNKSKTKEESVNEND